MTEAQLAREIEVEIWLQRLIKKDWQEGRRCNEKRWSFTRAGDPNSWDVSDIYVVDTDN